MYELVNRPCKHCGKILTTTSTREKVHAECRKEYYAKYRRNPDGLKRLTLKRNRSRWFINMDQCVVCGYDLMTKKRAICDPKTKEYKSFSLCPRCLAESRCGFLDVISKKRFDAEGKEVLDGKEATP